MDKSIEKINENIARALKSIDTRIDVVTFPVCQSIALTGEERSVPAVVLPNGECISIYDEADMHDITCYHRLNGKTYQETQSYGSRRVYNATFDMSVIVYGKRIINPIEAEKAICSAISSDNENELQSSDFNSLQVFAMEYSGISNFLNPDFFLFKINYRITCTINECKKQSTL